MATMVEKYRAYEPIVTFGGDFIGPSLMSGITKGAHMAAALDLIGVHYGVFGNHEWDFGADNLVTRLKPSQSRLAVAHGMHDLVGGTSRRDALPSHSKMFNLHRHRASVVRHEMQEFGWALDADEDTMRTNLSLSPAFHHGRLARKSQQERRAQSSRHQPITLHRAKLAR